MEPNSQRIEEQRRKLNNGLTQMILLLQQIRDNNAMTWADKLQKVIATQNMMPAVRRYAIYFINTEKK